MGKMLHISASPRGADSESLRIAEVFVEAYRQSHPDDEVEHWDLWNASIPYVLKQLIDVVSQPEWIFGFDARTGYTHPLAGRGKKVAVVYTSGDSVPPHRDRGLGGRARARRHARSGHRQGVLGDHGAADDG